MDARAHNVALNEREYNCRSTHLQSWPTMLYLELTQNCNLHCNMCRAARGYDASLDMPEFVFETVLRDLMPFASMVDLRGWGESTILPAFSRYLQEVVDTGVRPRIVTNGLAMTADVWDLFWSADGIVVVSIDAASRELFRDLGRGDLDKVVANIRLGRARCAAAGRGTIYFTTTVSAFNIHELTDIVEMAASLGINKVLLHPIKIDPQSVAALSTVREQLPDVLDSVRRAGLTSGVTVQLGTALDADLVVEEGLPTTCSSPWSHVLIGYRGDVVFCDHLLNRPELSMGNIITTPFPEIWNGDKFVAVRRAHIEAERSRYVGEKFRKCNWCYAHRYKDSESAPINVEAIREISTTATLPLYRRRHQ